MARLLEYRQALYVDPRTGLIRPNKNYRSWRHGDAQRRQREQLEIAARRRVVDERTMLLLLDDVWFSVEVEALPKAHPVERVVGQPRRRMTVEPRYDVVLRRHHLAVRLKPICSYASIFTDPAICTLLASARSRHERSKRIGLR